MLCSPMLAPISPNETLLYRVKIVLSSEYFLTLYNREVKEA